MAVRWGRKPAIYPSQDKPSTLRTQVDAIYTQMLAMADRLEAEAKHLKERDGRDHPDR